jgi:uncharacterized protein with von Willebrand factor type A (vWA) domain
MSKYPLTKLSLGSQKRHIKNIVADRKQLISKVSRFDCEVSEKQHDELMRIVRSINDKGSKVIKEMIDEGEHQLEGNNLLKDLWHHHY